MKSMLVLCSYHHNNTEKVARAFARVLGAQVKTPQQTDPEELQGCGLVGFGSGIYSSNFHEDLLALADRLNPVADGKAFLFSTSGVPSLFDRYGGSYRDRYARECHTTIRGKLQSKGYAILAEFIGWCQRSHIQRIHVDFESANLHARPFWLSHFAESARSVRRAVYRDIAHGRMTINHRL